MILLPCTRDRHVAYWRVHVGSCVRSAEVRWISKGQNMFKFSLQASSPAVEG